MAKLIAAKLELKDALVWIERELNGYTELSSDELPPYRRLAGEPKAWNQIQGRWLPIFFNDPDIAGKFSQAPIGQALGAVEQMLRDRGGELWMFPYPPELKAHVMKSIGEPTDVCIHLTTGSIWNIVDQVRNLILDWSIELEKAGVVGKDMTFSVEEKKEAAPVTHQFFAQNINIVGDVGDHAKVSSEQSATVKNSLDLDQIRDFASQLQGALSQLPDGARENLGPTANDLEEELASDKPDESKIRGLLRSIRTTCEGAAGNLSAQGIISLIDSIFQ